MAKTLYSVTMSVDGFIAGPGGDMSWMSGYLDPDPIVDDLVSRLGALLVGRKTFGGDDPFKGTKGEGEPFGGGWSGPQFVLTHRPPIRPVHGVTFVDEFGRALEMAMAAAGEKYVNVLGASIARQCLEAGALDEVLVCVAPVLLGDGVRLFDNPGGKMMRLERLSQSQGPQSTNIWYRVLR